MGGLQFHLVAFRKQKRLSPNDFLSVFTRLEKCSNAILYSEQDRFP